MIFVSFMVSQRKHKMNTDGIVDLVRQTGYELHVYFKNGFLEKVYENALANRLRKAGVEVVQQHPLNVYDYDGTIVGEYFADLFVEGDLIVELKAIKALEDIPFSAITCLSQSSQEATWHAHELWRIKISGEEIHFVISVPFVVK